VLNFVTSGRYNIHLDCIANMFVSNARTVAMATVIKENKANGTVTKPQDHTNANLMIWAARLNLTGEFVDILHRYTLFPKLRTSVSNSPALIPNVAVASQLLAVSRYVLDPKKTKEDAEITEIYKSWIIRKEKISGENRSLSGEFKNLLGLRRSLGYGSNAVNNKFVLTMLNLFFANYYAFVQNVLFQDHQENQFFERPYKVAKSNADRQRRDNITFVDPDIGNVAMNDITDLRIQNSALSNGKYNKKRRTWDGEGEIFRLVHIARIIFHSNNTSVGTHTMMSDQEKNGGKNNFTFDMDMDDVEVIEPSPKNNKKENTPPDPSPSGVNFENPALSSLATTTCSTMEKKFPGITSITLTAGEQTQLLSQIRSLTDAILTATTPKKQQTMTIDGNDLESTKTALNFDVGNKHNLTYHNETSESEDEKDNMEVESNSDQDQSENEDDLSTSEKDDKGSDEEAEYEG